MRDFAVETDPLEGWNLLEANAGTGKTYSICVLFLRLMLERGLDHEAIVTITFTKVATAELRTRILATLETAARLLGGGVAKTDDALLARVCQPHLHDPAARARVVRACSAFDLAPILTIHGFCQRLLSDFSLSTGFDPQLKLIENEALVLEPLVGQVWSRLSLGFSREFALYLQSKSYSRMQRLTRQIQQLAEKSYATLVGPTWADASTQEARLTKDFVAAKFPVVRIWREDREAIETLISDDPGLKRNTYNPGRITGMFAALARVLESDGAGAVDLRSLVLFTQAKITQNTKMAFRPGPQHEFFVAFEPFYAALEALQSFFAQREQALALELWPLVHHEYEAWKASRGLLTYADLIHKLVAALRDEAAAKDILAGTGQQFHAALIDEFQDTDTLQFEIFERLFANTDASVWLVGDPKQALYGFRGADVFAYLEARTRADQQYRLTTDWRAQPELMQVTNQLFDQPEAPFVVPEIEFAAAAAAPRDARRLLLDGVAVDALRGEQLGAQGNKPEMLRAGASACAAEITHLLLLAQAGRAVIEEAAKQEPLQARHMAVLVRNRKQAAAVGRELQQRNIACVQPAVQDVFESVQAEQLERLLHGVLFCDRPDRVAGAAATALVGANAESLVAMRDDDAVAENRAEQFSRWRQVWEEQGLAALLVTVLGETGAAARVLPLSDGKRSFANWFQLIELTERDCSSLGHSCAEQLAWLNRRRLSKDGFAEDALERLESQGDVVQIVTIHGAKGDQFPVTFCPFLWDEDPQGQGRNGFLEYHQQGTLKLDFTLEPADESKAAQAREKLSENVRLAYVALTRGICCNWIGWGYASGTHLSGMNYLLGNEGKVPAKGMADTLERQYRALEKIGLQWSDGAANLTASLPETNHYAHHEKPRRTVRPHWEVASYSSLFGDRIDVRDADEWIQAPGAPLNSRAGSDIFTLPAGARTGLMVHELLEILPSFQLETDAIRNLALLALARYGIAERFAEPLAQQVAAVLAMPLGQSRVQLCDIRATDQSREMEFSLRANESSISQFWQLVRGAATTAPVNFTLRGYLRGFIDLVVCHNNRYYVIDYKTNHLGFQPADYAAPALLKNVLDHHYDLQYHLYSLAVHRLLELTQADYSYDEHFGGVLYLYLRGMDGEGNGVHFARPQAAQITALNQLIC